MDIDHRHKDVPRLEVKPVGEESVGIHLSKNSGLKENLLLVLYISIFAFLFVVAYQQVFLTFEVVDNTWKTYGLKVMFFLFFIIAGMVLFMFINSRREAHTIVVSPETIHVRKKRLVWTKEYAIQVDDVLQVVVQTDTIVFYLKNKKKKHAMEIANDPELLWLVRFLNEWVKNNRN